MTGEFPAQGPSNADFFPLDDVIIIIDPMNHCYKGNYPPSLGRPEIVSTWNVHDTFILILDMDVNHIC